MRPLRVEAHLRGPIVIDRPVHLDALLGAAIVARDDLQRARNASECHELALPFAQERGVWLASASEHAVEERELSWVNKRFPVDMAQMLGDDSVRSIQITAGINRSAHEPLVLSHLAHDRLVWWCMGDVDAIEELLVLVPYVGGKRRFGHGEVRQWTVEACEPWGDGFPVVRDGMPLRNLPADWPRVSEDAAREWAPVRPPYWDQSTRVLAVVP